MLIFRQLFDQKSSTYTYLLAGAKSREAVLLVLIDELGLQLTTLLDDESVGFMNNLGLPHPKKIDLALPANLRSARPASGIAPDAGPNWAPLSYPFAGLWELDPRWLEERHERVGNIKDTVDRDNGRRGICIGRSGGRRKGSFLGQRSQGGT